MGTSVEQNNNSKRRNRLRLALNKDIKALASEVLRYRMKFDSNERDILFTLFLQLTVSTEGPDGRKVQYIERLEYTKSLGAAAKDLIGRLLKKPMNYVNELRITPLTITDCIWLPAEMKLTARHLIITDHYEIVLGTVGEFLPGINQRPFQSVGQESNKAITIKQVDPFIRIHTIRYSRLHFDFCPDFAAFKRLIDYWVIHGAQIGIYYTIHTTPRIGSAWYDSMKGREGRTVVWTPTRGCHCHPDCVIIPLPNNAQLEFYITSIFGGPYPTQLNLEVQPRK
ncbi:hypothetical protein CAEBREN_09034 [Caenorhabditis brenneri]|uniref:Uncharacterized protein n=1 Tax=Caenorhabditis brenneri TaxID=135651 RepID=G0PFA4_CAEBE|nr:hypothetical protein CAEBREN_09034 [Caenorhabditis brenneri]